MPLTFFTWLLAFLPVAVVLALMLGLKWGGSRAGVAGWTTALLTAGLFFGAGARLLAYTQVKGTLLTLDVCYVVWAALLLYHVANEAGAVDVIGKALPALTRERAFQGLLLGWLFASFLQGMGGFGVPVAVSAPLLVGLGYTPVQAVIMACIGHGWAVNFGSMATSFQTLMAVTGLPAEVLAPDSAIFLGGACLACGMVVTLVGDGWKKMFQLLPGTILLSAVMGGTQYLLSTHGVYTLGATGAAMAGLAVAILITRLPAYRGNGLNGARHLISGNGRPRSLWVALSGYAALVILAFGMNLIPSINRLVDHVQFSLPFPELQTGLGFVVPAEMGRSINIFGHPGAILTYASLVSYLIYRRAGYYETGALKRILDNTSQGAVNSSLGVAAMVGMAVAMSNSGMTNLLAAGLSQGFGKSAYPAVAPLIGALGAFITGSNNNSNVLFGMLQYRTAELLGLGVPLILGAQTAGGSLGSIMAPAKVIVGCSTVGLGDNEGVVMGKILIYGIGPVLLVALLALAFSWLGWGA
ncbi:MAG: L-lactate permease [Anaerolineae bacterium]|nr:L-lactate permease [Anaerolineae bacterium]